MTKEQIEHRIKVAIINTNNTKYNCVKSHNVMDELLVSAIQLGRNAILKSVRSYTKYAIANDMFDVNDMLDYLNDLEDGF